MTTIVGIFDNTRDVDGAVERLARAGFEEVVYDEAILSEEVGNVGPVFAPGFTPVVLLGSAKPAGSRKPDRSTIIRAFRVHLANYRVPKDVIESYVINFSHKGEFVLIRTDAARAAQVIEILGECRALRVNRHD